MDSPSGTIAPSPPARFVERFTAAWESRDPGALEALLHPSVRLEQPLLPPIEGRAAARRVFEDLLALIPDLRIEVHRWADAGDAIFIEFSFSGAIGAREVSWSLVDRIELSGGLVRVRVSYFDPSPLLRAILPQPAALWRLLRA